MDLNELAERLKRAEASYRRAQQGLASGTGHADEKYRAAADELRVAEGIARAVLEVVQPRK